MSKSARKKSLGGVAPFGYAWKEGHLVKVDEEAAIRKLAFDLFLKHRRKRTVARLLNELGYRTRRGSEFYDTTILRMLSDTTAKGVWQVGGREIPVEPIISVEVWDRVINILGGSKAARRPVHLFHGLLHCGCGMRMDGPGKPGNYTCSECKRKISAADLEEIFVAQIGVGEGAEFQVMSEVFAIASQAEKRTLIEQVCERIVLGATSIEIFFAFGPTHELAEPEVVQVDQAKVGDLSQRMRSVGSPEKQTASPLLSEAEAARFLNISKMTLMRKRKSGAVGYFQVGPHKKYSLEKHLLPYLEKFEKPMSQ